MAGVVMSGAASAIQEAALTPGCAVPLDLFMNGLSQQEAFYTLECMGDKGRELYLQTAIRQDSIYPFSYGALLFFTLFLLSSYCTSNKKAIAACCVLPFLIIISDFIENHFIIELIEQFPLIENETVTRFSIFNQLKWKLFFLALGLVLFFASWAIIKLKNKKRKP
jgi:hypothetical protein